MPITIAQLRVRVQTWLHPFADFYGKGNQIGNSLFGIGTGGWFGQGLYKGQPSKTPEVIMDCIFTAVCEELGGIIAIPPDYGVFWPGQISALASYKISILENAYSFKVFFIC